VVYVDRSREHDEYHRVEARQWAEYLHGTAPGWPRWCPEASSSRRSLGGGIAVAAGTSDLLTITNSAGASANYTIIVAGGLT
jgi:hypothetical protein